MDSRPSILITDDDRDFRETLGGIFEPLGLHILLASDGEEALGIIRSKQPVDLLLLDNNMPRLTGIETLRLVKQERAGLPCILLSARMDETVREEARQAHVFTVLSKPVSRGDITSSVAFALQQTYGWPETFPLFR